MVIVIVDSALACVSHSRGATCQISAAREVQGECRAELARAMLSRSLHSYSQLLDCEYKGTTIYSNTEIFYPIISLNDVNKITLPLHAQ